MLKDQDPFTPFPLKVNNLCYQKGNKALIDRLSFTIDKPGITAIMGPNGAGKSLTLRLLHGLLNPTSGTISWGTLEDERKVANSQAMVFQKPVLLRRTVAANLAYALKTKNDLKHLDHSKIIAKTLAHTGLENRAKSPARALSGGEQQRLAMARALMLHPKILFLDEPTSSLDPQATKAVEDLILEAAEQGTKIIIVTHDVGQAKRLSDEILFFHQGRMVEQGKTADILKSPKSKPAQQYFSGEIVTDAETA